MFAEFYILTIACSIGVHYFMRYCCTSSIPKEEVEGKVCSICLEELENVRFVCRTKCNHYYCEACLQNWLMVKKSCPMCCAEV